MKSLGITRPVDNLGRICLPRELRRTNNINAGDSMEIYTDCDQIVLKKYVRGCVFCGETDELIECEGILVCRVCGRKIARANT